jgi:hypothetical protein
MKFVNYFRRGHAKCETQMGTDLMAGPMDLILGASGDVTRTPPFLQKNFALVVHNGRHNAILCQYQGCAKQEGTFY